MRKSIDKDTLADLQKGDINAFNAVFKAYYNNIKYYIRDLTKSTEDAEELAQEVFIKVWEIKDRIDPERNFGSFLFKVAHNLSLKFIAKRLKEDAFLAELATDINEGASTDDEYLARELLLRLELAIEGLTDQKKKIYRMNVNDGKTIEEIATELDLNPRTVSNTLRLAINEVKEKVSVALVMLSVCFGQI